jgi:N-sulfoglucosamine sulfohydrolase
MRGVEPHSPRGRSFQELTRKQATGVRDELFAELTYHAAYDPQRAIRTGRHKLIQHFGERLEPVLPNVDDSPSKSLLIDAGWGAHRRPAAEMRNLAEVREFGEVRQELGKRLQDWMVETNDPLLDGPVPVPPGAFVNDSAGISATEPFLHAVG